MSHLTAVVSIPFGRGPRLRAVALAAAGLFTLASATAAQTSFEATLGGSVASLDEPGVGHAARAVARGALEVERLFDEERGRLAYSLDAGTYATSGDWRSFVHAAALVYRLDLKPEGRSSLFLGASGTLRDNGDAWGAADYRAGALSASSRWRLGGGATLRLGYRFDLRRFPDLGALDQEQHDGFAGLLVNLPSRTTLIGEVQLGAKAYAGEATTLAPPAPDTPAAASAPGHGHGLGPGGRGPDLRPVIATARGDAAHARLSSWRARVAQSLADRTGVSLQYSERRTSGRVPPALVTTPAGFFDDGVYDDPFASDARAWRLALKQVFAAAGRLEAWAARLERDFNGAVALDVEALPRRGGELRRDRVWRAGAVLRLPLSAERAGAPAFALELAYDFTDHSSNDAFYNYRSHGGGIALSIAY